MAALFDAPYHVVVANAGAWVRHGKVLDTSARRNGTPRSQRQPHRDLPDFSRGACSAMQPQAGVSSPSPQLPALKGGANIASYAALPSTAFWASCARWPLEMAKKGITCNAVCPGFVDTAHGRKGRFWSYGSASIIDRSTRPRPRWSRATRSVGMITPRRSRRRGCLPCLASRRRRRSVNGHALSRIGRGGMSKATATSRGPEAPSKARLRLWLKLLKATGGIEAEIRRMLPERTSPPLCPDLDVMSALARAPRGPEDERDL